MNNQWQLWHSCCRLENLIQPNEECLHPIFIEPLLNEVVLRPFHANIWPLTYPLKSTAVFDWKLLWGEHLLAFDSVTKHAPLALQISIPLLETFLLLLQKICTWKWSTRSRTEMWWRRQIWSFVLPTAFTSGCLPAINLLLGSTLQIAAQHSVLILTMVYASAIQ